MSDEKVIKLEEAPVAYNPHADWERLIGGLRAAMMEALVKKGVSPVLDPVPGHTMALGADKYGNLAVPALRGRYVAFAFDKYGRLSTGKGKGRLKPHWNQRKLGIKSLAIDIFRTEYAAYEKQMRLEDEKDGKEFQGISPEEFAPIAARSMKLGGREFKRRRKAERHARRERQRVSARINFGLIPGNADKRAHAEG